MASSLIPPGKTERVLARRALVLAPHYDDELLGCGGLLIQLAASGGTVKVLFLSDGGGGDETPDATEDYARRRRAEADAVGALLGFAAAEHLDVPDGALHEHAERLAAGVSRALEEFRPDLVLAPSPCEITADHQAAFAALHDALSGLRSSDPLHGALASTTILLYEVNHTSHPDLLVDVSAEMEPWERAVHLYASQLERHAYLRSARGLRGFRTLTLSPEVQAAEGYRRLRLSDLNGRSRTDLLRDLGAVSARAVQSSSDANGSLVSVVVRTRDRRDFLVEALESLAASEYRSVELVLVNDGGAPAPVPEDFPFPVTRIDHAETRGRAAAANAGLDAAKGEYVAFLDDDDLLHPEHLGVLVAAVSEGARVAYSDAEICLYERRKGDWRRREQKVAYSRDFDPALLLVDNYIPFNTLLMERELCRQAGRFDESLPFFEDWDFLIRLAALEPFRHVRKITCEYRHFDGEGHHVFGPSPHARADFLEIKARVLGKHARRITPELLAGAIVKLRAEAVRASDESRRVGDEAVSLSREVEQLRIGIADQSAHLSRVYGEIERLNADIRNLGEHPALRVYRLVRRPFS